MRVVVTRPAQDGQRWAERLRAHGHEPLLLPLLAIGAAPDPQAVRHAWDRLGDYAAVMFVSGNAVQGFFQFVTAVGWAVPGPRAWTPGPSTREALASVGVPQDRIDAPAQDAEQFDSESLWAQVAGQLRPGDRLLIVRGADGEGRGSGREWLGQQLQAGGVVVDTVAAYTRAVPAWDAGQQAQARSAAGDGSVWLFSSSEGAGNLARLLPGQDWSTARAIASHPRIAAAVRSIGFRRVDEARPHFDAVLASIESAG